MPKLTGDEALRQWLNAELDNIRAMQAEEPADLPRFLLRPDKQHAIKLAESGDTKLLRMYYPELAGVFDRVRKPRGGNRIKGINPFLKYGREGALETALQERETALALLKAHTGQQRGHVKMVESLVAERNRLTVEEVQHKRIRSRKR